MSLDAIRIKLFTYLNDNWTDTSIIFDGQDPDNEMLKSSAPWLYAYISWGSKVQKSRGGTAAYFSQTGVFAIRIYVPKSYGIAVRDYYTDELFTVFQKNQIEDVILLNFGIGRDNENADWYCRQITMGFNAQSFESMI